MKGISVIICCYNSKDKLKPTLKHLAYQINLSIIDWEIVLVNNNSTDNTEEFAKCVWKKCHNPAPLLIVKETTPGLSYARIRGVKTAKYDYVIFCDDDNWLAPDYLKRVFDVFSEDKNNKIACIGGIGSPVHSGPLQLSKDRYIHFACGPQKNTWNNQEDKVLLYGAGLAFRKNLFISIIESGYQFALTDRVGKSLISGGDTEFCILLAGLNYRLLFDPKLQFSHFISQDRLTEEYYERLGKAMVFSWQKLLPTVYALSGKRVNIITWVKDLAYTFYFLLLSSFRYRKNKADFNLYKIKFHSVLLNYKEYLKRQKIIENLKECFQNSGI